MEIIFDYTINNSGELDHKHLIETESGKYPQFAHAKLGAEPVDVIHLINAFHKGTLPIKGSGWDELTQHPNYPGKTRLEALVAEIIRLDDKPSRAVLGV